MDEERPGDLHPPQHDKQSSDAQPSLDAAKRAHVKRIVEACGNDFEAAAKALAITPEEVRRWLQRSDR